jgi:DNA-binding CsgD family transcriptional regulator
MTENRMWNAKATRPLRKAPGARLTGREAEVAALLAEGLTLGQVAQRMRLSPLTVKSHKRKVYQKLGVHTGAALVALMLRSRSYPAGAPRWKCPHCGYDPALNLGAALPVMSPLHA